MAYTYNNQQKDVVFYKGQLIVVMSGAGTGKTTVLKGYAKENPNDRMLYICFNSAIQKEAADSFPKHNVVCRTGHSIAFAREGRALSHKLTDNLRMTDVKNFLNIKAWDIVADTITVFNKYLTSADTAISMQHAITIKNKRQVMQILKFAQMMWDASIDPNHSFPCVNDVYMKLYALSPPELHKWFSTILLDEAQDTNPVLYDLVKKQKTKKVIVGDDNQQLYRFRGASNALSLFVKELNADEARITQSFRFGERVAGVANVILAFKRVMTNSDEFIISGNSELNDKIYQDLPNHLTQEHYTTLHRTVAGTIETALENKERRIYWIGGLKKYNLQELLDVYYLKIGQTDKIRRKKLLVDFKTYDIYENASEQSGDHEMKRMVAMVTKHGHLIPRHVALLSKNEVDDPTRANITIGTAHSSKGLEWPTVRLAEDFPELVDPKYPLNSNELSDELNLLYVACTRAILNLELNKVVYEILIHMKQQKKGVKSRPKKDKPAEQNKGRSRQEIMIERMRKSATQGQRVALSDFPDKKSL